MNKNDFSRRGFLKQNVLSGAGLVLLGGYGFGCDSPAQKGGTETHDTEGSDATFDNKRLEKLKERYHSDLFEMFLPNMDSLVIDHEFGGFMCSVDISTKNQVSSNK